MTDAKFFPFLKILRHYSFFSFLEEQLILDLTIISYWHIMKKTQPYGFSCNTYPNYSVKKKLIAKNNQIFKIKKYDSHNVMFSMPKSQAVAWMDYGLTQINRVEKFSQNPLAIDLTEVAGNKFLSVGCNDGSIFIRKLPDQVESG